MGCGYSTNNVIDDVCGPTTPSAATEAAAAIAVPSPTTTTAAAAATSSTGAERITTTSPPTVSSSPSTEPREEVPPTVTVTIPSYTGSYTDDTLNVIVVHFNPSNYVRRAVLTNECIQRLVETQLRLSDVVTAEPTSSSTDDVEKTTTTKPATSRIGLDITVVELCYGSNAAQIDPNNFPTVKTICCRCDEKHKMWSKEQLINIALDDQYLSPETKYVAWIDSDIAFLPNNNDQWVSDIVSCLSKYEMAFGQVWGTCDMLGPEQTNYEPKVTVTSFCAQYAAGKIYEERNNTDREYWHPGFGWMATVTALRATKGLIAQTLGSADRHMAMSFLGSVLQSVPDGISESYLDQILTWQEYVKENNIQLVYVPCHIQHYWHGPMRRRQYMGRFDILKKHQFDPNLHLRYHYTGLYLWTEKAPPGLLADIAAYFDQREEDSLNTNEEVVHPPQHGKQPSRHPFDDDDNWNNNGTMNSAAAAAAAAHHAAAHNAIMQAAMNDDNDDHNNNNNNNNGVTTTTTEEGSTTAATTSPDPLNIYA